MGPRAAACLRRLSGRDDSRTARRRGRKLIPARSSAPILADGFRDGRHELSHLCPGACGARPRLVGDSIRLRRGHLRGHRQKARPARACRFRDGPARDPGKSPRAGCLGHHHQHFKFGHDVRRASRTPLIAPGRKLVEGFVLTRLSSPFHGEVDRRQAARRRGAASAAVCLRQAPPSPGAHAPAPSTPPSPRLRRAHFPTMWGRKRALMLSPDVFRGPVAFQMQAQPGPGTGAGGNRHSNRKERPLARISPQNPCKPAGLTGPAGSRAPKAPQCGQAP